MLSETAGAPRRRSRIGRVLLAAALMLFAATGCENTPTGPSEEDIAAAQALADEGMTALIAAANSASPDFTLARTKFEDALELDSNNADANVGLAMIEFAELSQDPQVIALFGGSLPSVLGKTLPEQSGLAKVMSGPVAGSGLGVYTPAGVLDATHGRLMKMTQTGPTPGDVQDVAELVVLPVLEAVIGLLAVVENHPDWSITFTDAQTGGAGQLEIDVTDIYFLDAIVHGLKAEIHVLVSYNVDLPFTGTEDDTTVAKTYLDQDTGTFMTLRTNGATNMAAARATFLAGIQKMNSFLVSLQNETDSQTDDLIKIDPTGADGPTAADLESISLVLVQVSAALNGPQDVPGDYNGDGVDTETLQVDLRQIFINPIPDFKKVLPDYSWDPTWGDFLWDSYVAANFSQFTFPNPRFNGLFPQLTTSNAFKTFFGITDFPSPGPFISEFPAAQ